MKPDERKQPRPRRARLLPLTIAAMLGLLAVKTASLVGAAAGWLAAPRLVASAAAATPAPAQPIAPPHSAPPLAPPAPASPPQVAAPAGPPPISDAERALLLDLRHRRETLDQRAAALDARARILAGADARLGARLNEMTALRDKLQALEDARHGHDEANWAGLVKLYEAMKPRDAATIFNDLDMTVLLPVVDRMKEAKAAAILSAMDPAKARTLTTRLAQTRMQASTLDPKGG